MRYWLPKLLLRRFAERAATIGRHQCIGSAYFAVDRGQDRGRLPPEAQSLIETARREGVSGITGPLTTEAKDVVIGQEAAFSDRIVKFMDLVRALVVADNLKQRISRHKSFNVRSID